MKTPYDGYEGFANLEGEEEPFAYSIRFYSVPSCRHSHVDGDGLLVDEAEPAKLVARIGMLVVGDESYSSAVVVLVQILRCFLILDYLLQVFYLLVKTDTTPPISSNTAIKHMSYLNLAIASSASAFAF